MENPFDKKLSIIIVNYQSRNHLEKCLESLNKFFAEKPQIVVVNNDRGEDLGNLKTSYPFFTLINNPENVGFGRAHNQGASVSRGEVLLFLNPDTEIIKGDIKSVLENLNSRGIGILGPQLLNQHDKVQPWSLGKEISLARLLKNNLGFYNDHKRLWESREKVEVGWISGAALFIKKSLFQKLGGFDENFFLYFEDVDLCQRARQTGEKVVFSPFFKIRHFEGGSNFPKGERKKQYYKSQLYYFEKHRPFIEHKLLELTHKILKTLPKVRL